MTKSLPTFTPIKYPRSRSLDSFPVSLPSLRDEFLRTTNIHGFGYIYRSRVRFEKVFWTVSMLVFACFLGHDLFNLSKIYIEKPSAAEVRFFSIIFFDFFNCR